MTPESSDSPFVEQLIAQRDYYQAQIENFEQQASHARQQLVHINALLLDQFLPASDPSPIPSGTAELNEIISLREGEAIAATRQEPAHPALTSGSSGIAQLSSPTAIAEPPSQIFEPAAAPKPIANRKGRPQTLLPLLAPYAHLSKMAAVAQVLQEHHGNGVKPDAVIQFLYGGLSATDLKAEQTRMRATLNHGVRKGTWSKLKGRGGDYAWQDPNSAASQPEATKSQPKSAKASQRDKPAAKQTATKSATSKGRGQSLMDQVSNVMQSHPGEVMTSELVAKELFGSLPSKQWATARKRISGIFSQGVQLKKWQRVANQKGAYILE
ncbi:MAG: hypothetical protein KME35_21535 [Aphanocapsa sp. GSE-SYN-MK-11-07L]|jgi:hypothetical protein|nr:hypothetical protein [Aphanocapsa sp. GSE-SYN-MK-11-07L]